MSARTRLSLLACAALLPACGSALPPAGAGARPADDVSVPAPPAAPPDAPPEPGDGPDAPPRAATDKRADLIGRSKEHAIEVCQPPGQRAYLARLRCTDGQPPRFHRTGNVGARHDPKPGTPDSVLMDQMDARRVLKPGEVDYHIVDLYEVACSDKTHEIYMDMYHCAGPQTAEAPSGFTIVLEGGI